MNLRDFPTPHQICNLSPPYNYAQGSNDLPPVLMNDIFKLRGEQTYNLRELSQFYKPKVNSVCNGTKNMLFSGPVIWDLVPNELKDIGNLAAFKKQSKSGHQRNVLVGFVKLY